MTKYLVIHSYSILDTIFQTLLKFGQQAILPFKEKYVSSNHAYGLNYCIGFLFYNHH